MSKKIVCPRCGSTEGFEEVLFGMTPANLIFLNDNERVDYGEMKAVGRLVDVYYQCRNCEHKLDGVMDLIDFEEWAKEHLAEEEV